MPVSKLFPCLLTAALCLPALSEAQTVTLGFDNTGAEAGVTTPGTTTFSFQGSNWSGGMVASVGNGALYASGAFSYMNAMLGEVTFDSPVDSATFFYVHTATPGTATAYDAGGAVLASVPSNSATFFGDPTNFVTLDPAAPIARIEFAVGVVDSFSFDLLPVSLPSFRRGDVNDDAAVNIADPVDLLGFLFQMGAAPVCPDAADSNDDGGLDLSDVVFTLTYLFANGVDPSAPGPMTCGDDPTIDSLGACASAQCP